MQTLETRAVAIARADKRALRAKRMMDGLANSGHSFAFRLAALSAMGGERRVM